MKVAVGAPLDLKAAGGVEIHILELTKALRRGGVEAEIFTKEAGEEFRSLRRLEDYDFDIIHTHGSFFSRRFPGLTRRRKRHQRHVHTLHGVSIDYLLGCRSWLNWRCYTSTLAEGLYSRYADHVIAVSERIKRRARQCFGIRSDKITVIGNGYSPEYFSVGERDRVREELNFSADDVVALFVGRGVDKVKGAAAVAAAMGKLQPSYPNLHLLAIPGDGFGEAAWLRKTGPVDYKKIHRFYRAADIFVNASLNEGMPLTVIEAMAASLPIVAANAGGIPELIIQEQTGLLLKPDRSDLAKKLERLIKYKSLREKLGQKAHDAAQVLTWDQIAKHTIMLYESIVNAPPSPSCA